MFIIVLNVMKTFLGWVIGIAVFFGICFAVSYFNSGDGEVRISPDTPQTSRMDCPDDQPIKGNAQSGIYHMRYGQYYDKTSPERCFATEEEAREAGYRASER